MSLAFADLNIFGAESAGAEKISESELSSRYPKIVTDIQHFYRAG